MSKMGFIEFRDNVLPGLVAAGTQVLGLPRASFVAMNAAGNFADVPDRAVIIVDGLGYLRSASSTAIDGLPGWVPWGDVYPDHWTENVSPGVTSMTAALNAAAAYVGALGGGEIRLRGVSHLIDGTIQSRPGVKWRGVRGQTVFWRATAFGDTLAQTGGFADVRGIYFRHATPYAIGDTALNVRLTDGAAHLRLIDCGDVIVDDCLFWRGTYGIVIDGCHNWHITRCRFRLTWDPATPALQEGIADVDVRHTNRYAQIGHIRHNYFSGCAGPTRAMTWTDATGASITASVVANIGARDLLRIAACEDLSVSDNYFGRGAEVLVHYVVDDAAMLTMNHRFVSNFFDNCGNGAGAQIRIESTAAEARLTNLALIGNTFNGQFDAVHALEAAFSSAGGPVVYGLTMTGNNCLAHVGAPIVLHGAKGGVVAANTLTGYNGRSVSAVGADALYSAGIVLDNQAYNVNVDGNTIGLGGNNWSSGAVNRCHYGIRHVGGAASITARGNRSRRNLDAGINDTFDNSSSFWAGSSAAGSWERTEDGRISMRGVVTSSAHRGVVWAFPAPLISTEGVTVSLAANAKEPRIPVYAALSLLSVEVSAYDAAGARTVTGLAVEVTGRWV